MDDVDEKMEKLKETIEEIFGNDAKVSGFSGKSVEEVIKKAKKYMTKPIVTLYATRSGTGLQVQNCSTSDAYNAAIHIITHALQMFPKEDRNDMLFEAIQDIDNKYDEGMLFMEEDEDEDEDE